MEVKNIQERIQAVDSALIDKGFKSPDCDITITANDLTFWIKTGGTESYGRMFECVTADSMNDLLQAASEYVGNL